MPIVATATNSIADAPDLSQYGTVSGDGANWNAADATAKAGETALLSRTYLKWVRFIVAAPGGVNVNQASYGATGQDVYVYLVKGPASGDTLTDATLPTLGAFLGSGDDNAGSMAGAVSYTATADDVGRWFYVGNGSISNQPAFSGTIRVDFPAGVLGAPTPMKPVRVVSGVAVPSSGQLWPRGSRAR